MDILNEFLTEVKKFGVSKVARISGVCKHTIFNWIYGTTTPTLTKAQQVANAMGLEFLIFDKIP